MSFVDEVTVFVTAGRGGDGSASMRSEPYTPRGGPDGGNGGDGGDVVFEVRERVRDLSALADHPHQKAPSGGGGARMNRTGARGGELVIAVPDGTRVEDEGGLVADLVGAGARAVVARGGRGGRGNASLAGPRNKAPQTSEAGEPGEERRLRVELRTVADVGLVGLPNAGKSTLLAALTAAKPKIASYPFTTLTPNLGVAVGDRRFVVADIPGLVEGAAEGKGLGHRFLRHVSRCRALAMVIDLSASDPGSDLRAVREEVDAYDPELAARPFVVVGTKADLVEDPTRAGVSLGPAAVVVSGVTGDGVEALSARLESLVESTPGDDRRPLVVLRPARAPFVVRREGERFRVVGRSVERWVAETDFEDAGKVATLQRRLIKEGVERQLAASGAEPGDEIVIGDRAFEFIPGGAIDGAS
jgi:GTP-binding protein